MKNVLEEVKKKTLEILGSSDLDVVNHITNDYLNQVDELTTPEDGSDDKAIASTYYGHDMAYVYSERYGEYGYSIRTGSKSATSRSCGTSYGYFLAHSEYDHDKVGDCSSRDALLKFSRK